MGHSGPLGLSQPSLSSLFPPSSRFHLSLIPVGLSDPLGYLLYTLELPPLPSSLFVLAAPHMGPRWPAALPPGSTGLYCIWSSPLTGYTPGPVPPHKSHWVRERVMSRCDKFGLPGTGAGREGRVMIFASLIILRVFSSLPVFGLSVLFCGLWCFWLGGRISFQELIDLNELDAHSKFLTCHLCFWLP